MDPGLGAASFSFHAKRVIFCEGEDSSRDADFFRAWFDGVDTFVKPVGSNQLVLRCTQALRSSGIAMGLDARGLIDRDYLPLKLLQALREGVQALPTHEIEGIYCLPKVVEYVPEYLGKEFDAKVYVSDIRSSIDALAKNALIISRWKRKLEPNLESLLSGVSTRASSIDDVIAGIPTLFDPSAWSFSPTDELRDQRDIIEILLESGPVEELLAIFPSKPLISTAAKPTGLTVPEYISLINRALRRGTPSLLALGEKLEVAMSTYLPPRVA